MIVKPAPLFYFNDSETPSLHLVSFHSIQLTLTRTLNLLLKSRHQGDCCLLL